MTEWPADEVERRPIADLVFYARNARTHSDEQVAQIAASIREWGWTNPVLVDESGTIIAGHGRVLAAQRLGFADVPVMTARGWSEAQIRAYVIADNKLTENAGWDRDLLRLEVADLEGMGFDLPLMGFSADELSELSADETAGGTGPSGGAGSLADRFGIPPFSVLNAREGWWQDRKRAWLSLGIQSELGRGEQLIPNGEGNGSKARYDLGGERNARRTDDAGVGLQQDEGSWGRSREGGLTWGNHPGITERGLNHYRNKRKAARG